MRIIYNILIIIVGIILAPYIAVKVAIDARYRKGIMERFGFVAVAAKTRRRFLVHAASVGEVNVAAPFIREIINNYKDCEIILTVMTPEGHSFAEEKLKGLAQIFFFPLDYTFCVSRFLSKVEPDFAFIIETEFWPNFLRALRRRGVKVGIINGRVSDKSFQRYMLVKGFMKSVLSNVDFFLMQQEVYKERVFALTGDNSNIKVVGNIKFDIDDSFFKIDDPLLQKVKGLSYIVAASVHEGEEEKIFLIFSKIKKYFSGIKLVVAPRHIKRTPAVEALLSKFKLTYIKRTQLAEDTAVENYDVILVDTIGDLPTFLKGAKLVFMGGSLVNVGGHNIIEPAYFSKPTIFGRFMQNFEDAKELLLNGGGAISVDDEKELEEEITFLLRDEAELIKIGANAKLALSKNKGSLQKVMAEVKKYV